MSAHAIRLLVPTLLLCVALGAVLWLRGGTEQGNAQPTDAPTQTRAPSRATYTGTLRGVTLTLEVVQTPEEQQRGLSGRDALSEDYGMLFAYTRDEYYGFWMPDMHFAIDILWLNHAKEVVHIEHGVSPDSYPAVFRPDVPARYVLEVSAGWATLHGVEEGDTLSVEGLAL